MIRVKPRLVAVGAAVIALAAAAGVLARSGAPPDPLQQATADGCERDDATLHTLEAPNWVYVNDKDYPASGSPPALKLVSGVVQKVSADVHTSGGDNPVSHAAYDVNFDVNVDPAFADLVARTNTTGGLHVEREEGATPTFVWPEPGDRVTLVGYWVWDCDHFTTKGEVTGEETELHPLTGTFVERARTTRSRTGGSELDVFFTTDKTTAGKNADCAHRTKHNDLAFKACVLTEPDNVDMSGTFGHAMLLPPRPTASSRLVVTSVDAGSVNAPPVGLENRGTQESVSFTIPKDGKRHVVAKKFFFSWTNTRTTHLRVTFDKVLIRRAMDPACIPAAPPGCGTPETTRDDQVSRGPNGEWNIYSDVAGNWSLWTPNVWKVRDGQTIEPKKTFDVWVAPTQTWRVFVWTRECDWGTLRLGGSNALFPCPRQAEVGNRGGDDVPGFAVVTFRSIAAAIGRHSLDSSNTGSTCPPVNTKGCYRVTFTVSRVPG